MASPVNTALHGVETPNSTRSRDLASRRFRPHLAACVERLGATSNGTVGLASRRVVAVACCPLPTTSGRPQVRALRVDNPLANCNAVRLQRDNSITHCCCNSTVTAAAAENSRRRRRRSRSSSGQVPGARSSTSNICYLDRHPQAASTPEAAELYPIAIRADWKH